jgi:BCD family chlorophyll transporter-like MFS transporter
MGLEQEHSRGLVLGAWGAAQATAAGLGIAIGGALRDITAMLAQSGSLGTVLTAPATGYAVVYQFEIGLLFMTLIALGPLVKIRQPDRSPTHSFGLAEFPS